MRISYSSLDTYKSCPLRFKFQVLDKIRAPKNAEMAFGSTIHSSLKYMFERTPLYPTVEEVINFFRNKWNDQISSSNFGKTPEELEAHVTIGIDLLKRFYKSNPPWNFDIIDLESFFEAELEDPKTKEKHLLTGIIDRIDKNHEDGSYEIVDYKTAKRMPAQKQVDQDLQLSIYHLGLVKRWPHLEKQDIKLSLYYLKHNEKISTHRAEKELDETKKIVLGIINEIEEKIADNYNFPPTPSVLCDWCGYKKMCPMWKHLYKEEIKDLKSEEEIKSTIKEYFDLKEQNSQNTSSLNELKKIISKYMDTQKVERVFGDEGYITRKEQERSSYDTSKMQEILEPTGKWQDILSPDEKKLEKIISYLPEKIQKKILDLKTTKKFSVMSSTKKKITK